MRVLHTSRTYSQRLAKSTLSTIPKMSRAFSTVPSTAKVSPAPFKVSISDDRISELQALVKLSKLAPPTYEGLQKDRRLGITTEWLASAKEKWQTEFDW
jgi:microsomal epoxide hydrolase